MNENSNNASQGTMKTPPPGEYRPKFSIYHASPKGNGSAIKMELHPAHDDVAGSIWLSLACQKTIGSMRGPNPTYSTFNWDTSITIKLDFNDLVQMLQVFRGETESVNGDKGLFHRSRSFNTVIKFRHQFESYPGYMLEIYRNAPGQENDLCGFFLFSPAEALGISVAIENNLGVICFGIPKVIPHDTSDYRRDVKEMRNVAAA